MEQIKWVDRKFHFGYDIGYTPLFVERLKAAAPRLEELMNLTDEYHAAVQKNKEWSAKEHAGHLSDLEHLHDGRIDDFIAGLPLLRAADMTNKATFDGLHNERSNPELLSLFRHSRDKFIDRIESLDEMYFERKALHPRLQQMISITDSLFFIAEHDNHHLAKIAALCRAY